MGGGIDIAQRRWQWVIHDHDHDHLVNKVRCMDLPDSDWGDFSCRRAVDSSSWIDALCMQSLNTLVTLYAYICAKIVISNNNNHNSCHCICYKDQATLLRFCLLPSILYCKLLLFFSVYAIPDYDICRLMSYQLVLWHCLQQLCLDEMSHQHPMILLNGPLRWCKCHNCSTNINIYDIFAHVTSRQNAF